MTHKMREIIEFGEWLVVTEDLDPVYCALSRATLPRAQLQRLLLAYFCFYHLGVAAWLSEQDGCSNPSNVLDPLVSYEFWELMENAAANAVPPNTDDLPGERWPRGSERRHFRGKKCVDAVRVLRGPPVGLVNEPCYPPTYFMDTLMAASEGQDLATVMGWVQKTPMFGPWIAFKVADILERVCKVNVIFPNDLTLFYSEPRKALDMLELPAEKANAKLRKHFAKFTAPPRHERPCNIQEIETICCKWKSSLSGHYWVGKDIKEIRHALKGWGKTADRLLKCMPPEVEQRGSLFT